MTTTSSKRSVGAALVRLRAAKAYDGPITADVEIVTPELAAEWLQVNTHNRNLNKSRVDKYADFVKRGQWRAAVADIAFDTNGILQNGQHTLSACVAANKSIVCTVKRGMAVEAQMITDTGRGRSLAGELQLAKMTNATTIAAAVRQFPVWIHIGTFGSSDSGDGQAQRNAANGADNGASNDIDLAAYCIANREFLIRQASLAESRAKNTPTLTGTNLMVMSIVFNHFADDYGDEFLRELCREVDACAQPVRKYQMALLSQVGNKARWHNNFKYAMAVKAFNAFMARAEIKTLRWGANEAFPTINVPEGAKA